MKARSNGLCEQGRPNGQTKGEQGRPNGQTKGEQGRPNGINRLDEIG